MQRLEPIKPGHLVACHQVMERGGYDALEAEKARRKA
jgi:hypothetical protein